MARIRQPFTRPYWVVYLGILGSLGGIGLLWFAGAGLSGAFLFFMFAAPATFLGVIITLPSRMRPRPMCYGVYAAVNLTLLTFGMAVLIVASIENGLDDKWVGAFYLESDESAVRGTLVFYTSVLCYGLSGVLAAREAWNTRWRARLQRGEEHG